MLIAAGQRRNRGGCGRENGRLDHDVTQHQNETAALATVDDAGHDRAFGAFLHHDPAMEPNRDRKATWMEFEQAYSSLYGELGFLWELSRPPE